VSGTDLLFRVLAMNEASKVFKEVQASAAETAAAVDESNATMARSSEETAAKQEEAAGAGDDDKLLASGPLLLGVAAAAVVVGAKCVDMAAKFQTGMTTLVTGAGESQKNMKLVSDGILTMAVSTGTSTSQLISGMYMIESAGFHGASGLKVLQAAAEGAKVGNADLSTVGNALTDVLNDYHLPASQAVAVTDQLVTTVASGKTTMEELGSSLSNVVPLASSAGISFAQVGGALATMTGHGMSAQQASQDLANTIRSLQAPNNVAVKEMQSLGLSSTDVSMQLGKKGLTGTLAELTSAITSHMGPAGTVLQSSFASSTTAAADAKQMISSLPASMQKLADSYLQGSVTSKQWRTDLQGLDPVQAHLMTQFAGVADKAHSFNDLLASGGPAAQTYNAALGKMVGGATGLNTALMLTGENSSTFAANVKSIGAAATGAGKNVTGWSDVTNTLSFKMDQAKEVVETLGIRIGLILMPAVKLLVGGFTDVARYAMDAVTWLGKHKTVAEALGIGIGMVLLPAIWGVVSAMGAAAISGAILAAEFLIPIAVCAALGYGILELIKHWGDVEHVFDIGIDFIKDHWKEFVAALLPGVGMIIVGITELVQHWGQVESFLVGIWHDVVRFFNEVFVDPLEQAWHDLVSWYDDAVQAFKVFFTDDIPGWWDDAVHLFTSIFVTPLQSAAHTLIGWFNDEVQAWKLLFTHDIPSWWDDAVHLFDSVFVNPLHSALSDVERAFESVFGGIKGFVSSAFGDLVGIIKSPVDGVIGLVDEAIGYLDGLHVSIPSWVPVIGGDSFGVSIPKIPMLAHGGLVMPQPGGVQVTVAEAGQAEIVTPLPAMQAAMTAALVAAGHTTAAGAAGGAGSSPGNPLYLQLELKMDGKTIDKQLVKYQLQGGRLQSVAMAVA
jgi:TP901 family phage tail tape measure protein